MGRYLEEFVAGEVIETNGRTITETDLVNFCAFTGDWNPLHADEEFATGTPFGQRIAHGPMFIGIAFGLLSTHGVIDGTVLALHRVEWDFDAPVVPGDTVKARFEVLSVSPHPGGDPTGRVLMAASIANQRGEEVSRGTLTLVMRARG